MTKRTSRLFLVAMGLSVGAWCFAADAPVELPIVKAAQMQYADAIKRADAKRQLQMKVVDHTYQLAEEEAQKKYVESLKAAQAKYAKARNFKAVAVIQDEIGKALKTSTSIESIFPKPDKTKPVTVVARFHKCALNFPQKRAYFVDDVYRSDGTVYTDDQWHWSGEWQVQGRVVKIHWRAGPNNPECVDTLTLNDAGTMLMGTNSLSDDIAHLRIAERVDLSRDKSTKPAH